MISRYPVILTHAPKFAFHLFITDHNPWGKRSEISSLTNDLSFSIFSHDRSGNENVAGTGGGGLCEAPQLQNCVDKRSTAHIFISYNISKHRKGLGNNNDKIGEVCSTHGSR
jgi:hypothetical protein